MNATPITDIREYQEAALRTRSPHWNGKRVSFYEFMRLMQTGFALGDHARVMKKTLISDPAKLGPEQRVLAPEWERHFGERHADAVHAVLGIVNECGELCGAVLKALRDNEKIDWVNFFEEIGDMQWFQMLGCHAGATDPAAVLGANIAKLRARFPDKFTSEANDNRDLAAEHKALVGEPKLTQIASFGEPKLTGWIASCGRVHLMVSGFAVATQGDLCRDPDLRVKFQSETWTPEMIKHICGDQPEVLAETDPAQERDRCGGEA